MPAAAGFLRQAGMIAQLLAHEQSGDHLMDREETVGKSLRSWLSKAHASEWRADTTAVYQAETDSRKLRL